MGQLDKFKEPRLTRGSVARDDPLFYRDVSDRLRSLSRRTDDLENDGAVNVALAINGAVATATSQFSAAYLPGYALRGDRRSKYWSQIGGYSSAAGLPQTFTVTFKEPVECDRIELFFLPDAIVSEEIPNYSTTCTLFAPMDFSVKRFNVAGARTVIATVTGNNKQRRRFDYAPVLMSGFDVECTAALGGFNFLQIVSAECYSAPNVFSDF